MNPAQPHICICRSGRRSPACGGPCQRRAPAGGERSRRGNRLDAQDAKKPNIRDHAADRGPPASALRDGQTRSLGGGRGHEVCRVRWRLQRQAGTLSCKVSECQIPAIRSATAGVGPPAAERLSEEGARSLARAAAAAAAPEAALAAASAAAAAAAAAGSDPKSWDPLGELADAAHAGKTHPALKQIKAALPEGCAVSYGQVRPLSRHPP